jgi:hypothetical protein
MEMEMAFHEKDRPSPEGDKSSKQSSERPAPDSKGGKKAPDPHPATEEGYDRPAKVPMTGL